jgi:anthranilate phosphoribosyltransferase
VIKDFSLLLEGLLQGANLTEREASYLMHALAEEKLSSALAGAFLSVLRMKGETADEIRGFASAMRELAIKPTIPDGKPIVDTVGTGGDGSSSFNLSTGTGLLAAACGSRVVKHGNRSVSSKSGSADMLESLGMQLPSNEEEAVACLKRIGFTFLFAPVFHPAMKAVVPIRGALSIRTVFNVLGPLTNPATPPFHLIGAYSKDVAKLMADALSGMELERTFVVHSELGWDEATPAGDFWLYDVSSGNVKETIRSPEDYGLKRCNPSELKGGDAKHNANELMRVFKGEDKGAHRDALLMGTSLVLEVQGEVKNAKEGVEMASAAIDDYSAFSFLKNLREYFTIDE